MDERQTAPPPGYVAPTSAEELLQRYAAGERHFWGADIPDGTSFRSAVLAGAGLEKAWFFDADFSNADLRGVSFEGTNLKCADFSGADLRGASFRNALVEATTWVGANLAGTTFEGATYHSFTIHDDDRQFPSERDVNPPTPDSRA